MSTITVAKSHDDYVAHVESLSPAELILQDAGQQGAIHAVSFLIKWGCTEQAALEMLASLRKNAQFIRDVAAKRGVRLVHDSDQTEFS